MSGSGGIGDYPIGDFAIGDGYGNATAAPLAPQVLVNTRILSFLQMVQEADPDFRRLSNRPMAYVFSNGRRFYDPMPLYGQPYMYDDSGNIMLDEFGNPMRADTGAGASTGGFPFGSGAFGDDQF